MLKRGPGLAFSPQKHSARAGFCVFLLAKRLPKWGLEGKTQKG
jgi:hypothetical protein